MLQRERMSIWLVTCSPMNDLPCIRRPSLADLHVPMVGNERLSAGGQVRVNLTFMCGGLDYCTDLILSPYNSHAGPLVCDSLVPPVGWVPCCPADFGLGPVILFGQWKHVSRWLQCALLASLPCLLPWEEHIPRSQVAAGPRMRVVWKVLAPTCSLRLSSSIPEQEISPVVVHHQKSFLFFWSHNIIVAEIWPIQQPSWLMYPFIVQKTEEGARVISNVGNKSISLRVM